MVTSYTDPVWARETCYQQYSDGTASAASPSISVSMDLSSQHATKLIYESVTDTRRAVIDYGESTFVGFWTDTSMTMDATASVRFEGNYVVERVYTSNDIDYGEAEIRYSKNIDGTYFSTSCRIPHVHLERADFELPLWMDHIKIKPYIPSHQEKMQEKINKAWSIHEYEERRKEKELAEEKAVILLGSLIGEKELEVYKKTERLFVKGKNGVYYAKKGGGIAKIEGNKIINFCVSIDHRYGCPPTDQVVAMKLLLEDNDTEIINIANRMSTKEVEELPLAACM